MDKPRKEGGRFQGQGGQRNTEGQLRPVVIGWVQNGCEWLWGLRMVKCKQMMMVVVVTVTLICELLDPLGYTLEAGELCWV